MIWAQEERVVYHTLDLGIEQVLVPVRVKFQFQVDGGAYVPDSLAVDTVYNQPLLEKRYPNLDLQRLEDAIAKTVRKEIFRHLQQSGFF